MRDKSDYTICKSYDGENNYYKTYYTLRDEIINSIYDNVDNDTYRLIEENLENIEEIIDQLTNEVNYNEMQSNLYKLELEQINQIKDPIEWYESYIDKLRYHEKMYLKFLLWKNNIFIFLIAIIKKINVCF